MPGFLGLLCTKMMIDIRIKSATRKRIPVVYSSLTEIQLMIKGQICIKHQEWSNLYELYRGMWITQNNFPGMKQLLALVT